MEYLTKMDPDKAWAQMDAMVKGMFLDDKTYARPEAFGCGQKAFLSNAPLPTCPESCSTCAGHFLPLLWQKVPSMRSLCTHDDQTAADEIRALTTTITDDIVHVRQTLQEYGNGILKRWRKRTAAQRTDLLLTAMPAMCKHKWAAAHVDLEIRRRYETTSPIAAMNMPSDAIDMGKRNAQINLLSYIDVPTLSRDATKLLCLLQNRSQFDPAQWVMFDYEQVKPEFDVVVCMEVKYNPHCVSMQHDTFGQLVHWDETLAHRFRMVGYPRARLILQAQATLLGFLRHMTDLILENDIDQAPRGRDKWDDASTNGFVKCAKSGLELARINPAYSTPPQLNLQRVVDILRTRCNASADALWLFQVDPQYTRAHLSQMRNTTNYGSLKQRQQLESSVDTLLQPLHHLSMWQYLLTAAEKALGIQRLYRQQVMTTDVPCIEYDMALRQLQHDLECQVPIMQEELFKIIITKGIFPGQFEYDANRQGYVPVKQQSQEVFKKDPLLWNVIELLNRNDEYSRDFSYNVASIDEIISDASAKERARIDTTLYTHLSSIAAVSDALAALKYNLPHHGPRLDASRMVAFSKKDHFKEQVFTTMRSWDWSPEDSEFPALHNFLRLPIPTAKVTEKTFGQVLDLHKALVEAWSDIRHYAARSFGMSSQMKYGDMDVAMLTKIVKYFLPLTAHETQEYKTLQEEEMWPLYCHVVEYEKKCAIQSKPAISKETKEQSAVQTTWGPVAEETFQARQFKEKLKTRSASSTFPTTPAPVTQDLKETVSCPAPGAPTPIPVSRASIIILTSMFAAAADMRSNTRWEHFVSAMTDAGFSATHNGGSAVTFRDEKPDNGSGGAIVLHRPHPDPSIDPVMLRSFGKRFRKWFGWDAATFVER